MNLGEVRRQFQLIVCQDPEFEYAFLACIQSYGEPSVIPTHLYQAGPGTRTLSESSKREGHPIQVGWSTELGPHRSHTSLEAYGR